MDKTVNVIGATGLVGRQLVKQLLREPGIGKIRIFTRRKTGFEESVIEEHIVDFDDEKSWKSMVSGDILFSSLGTTLKQAGSKAAQYKVDYTYQYQFARAAAASGVSSLVLVSSAGADSGSSVFYSRMKGELDEAVQLLPFRQCIILRPSILEGDRDRKRPTEILASRLMRTVSRFILKKYRPIPGRVVARAMINASLHSEFRGVQCFTLDEIFKLAKD